MSEKDAYLAAFIYGLRLIDNKARELGTFEIPFNPDENVKPEIDVRALVLFTHQVASRILGNQLTVEMEMAGTD